MSEPRVEYVPEMGQTERQRKQAEISLGLTRRGGGPRGYGALEFAINMQRWSEEGALLCSAGNGMEGRTRRDRG